MNSLPALLTPLPLIPFTIEEITSCTSESTNGASKAPGNLPYCFFISCFIVSVTPSINTPESSNDSTILIISFVSSLMMSSIVNEVIRTIFHLFIFSKKNFAA